MDLVLLGNLERDIIRSRTSILDTHITMNTKPPRSNLQPLQPDMMSSDNIRPPDKHRHTETETETESETETETLEEGGTSVEEDREGVEEGDRARCPRAPWAISVTR